MTKVTLNATEYDADVIAHYMDDDLREEIHASFVEGTEQDFVDMYAAAHKARFGMDFVVA